MEFNNKKWRSYSVVQRSPNWKSLTIPATLPITTDYLPDEGSLAMEYLVNEYDLSPETILVEATTQLSPLDKPKLTIEESFWELISQRLAQGFQWIIPPTKEDTRGDISYEDKVAFEFRLPPLLSEVHEASRKKTSLLPSKKFARPWAEYWISIGRIFHKVTLNADQKSIKVKKYTSPPHGPRATGHMVNTNEC